MARYVTKVPFSIDLRTKVLRPLKELHTTGRELLMLVIDGLPGRGKTTLAVHIADWWEKTPINIRNDPRLSMGGADLMAKAEECYEKGYKVIIYDEAGDFSSRTWNTSFNKTLYNFFQKARAYNLLLIIVTPNFWDLDKGVYDLGVFGLIHCQNPKKHYTDFGVYDARGLSYLRTKADKLGYGRRLAYVQQHPYLRGHFRDLSPERSALLRQVSLEQKRVSNKKARKALEGKGERSAPEKVVPLVSDVEFAGAVSKLRGLKGLSRDET